MQFHEGVFRLTPVAARVGHEAQFQHPDFCVAANTWATRWRAHQAVAADEVLGLRLTRRGGLQPLRELLVAHAFVVQDTLPWVVTDRFATSGLIGFTPFRHRC